jgi:hypothetical protein
MGVKRDKQEWSMGNGQCPICEGLKPNIFRRYTLRSHGHEKTCLLANALEKSGERVCYKSENSVISKKWLYSDNYTAKAMLDFGRAMGFIERPKENKNG